MNCFCFQSNFKNFQVTTLLTNKYLKKFFLGPCLNIFHRKKNEKEKILKNLSMLHKKRCNKKRGHHPHLRC
jgi:hypothetical protein